MSDLFYITSRLAKISRTDEERDRVQKYFTSISGISEKQAEYFHYAKKWKLAPWLHTRMQREGLTGYLNEQTATAFGEMHAKTLLAVGSIIAKDVNIFEIPFQHYLFNTINYKFLLIL